MITERQQVNAKFWDADICAYVARMDNASNGTEVHRHIWFYGTGRTGAWVIQMIDNEGNQIGDAEYAANKGALRHG